MKKFLFLLVAILFIQNLFADADRTCAEYAYSRLQAELGSSGQVAISGKLDNETKFIFSHFDVQIPKNQGKKNAVNQLETGTLGTYSAWVYSQFEASGITPDEKTAGILACGIMSGTQYLKDKAKTSKKSEKYLKKLCQIASIKDRKKLYSMMYEASLKSDAQSDVKILLMDYREYDFSGTKIGVSCVNCKDDAELAAMVPRMQLAMAQQYPVQKVKHIFVIVENCADSKSAVLCFGPESDKVLQKCFPDGTSDGIVYLNERINRKKELLPLLENAYRE